MSDFRAHAAPLSVTPFDFTLLSDQSADAGQSGPALQSVEKTEPVRRYSIALPVTIDGLVLGEMTTDVGLDSSILVNAERLATLLDGIANKALMAHLTQINSAFDGKNVPTREFDPQLIAVDYDASLVNVVVTLTPEGRQKQSLGSGANFRDQRGAVDESNFSIGLSLFARQAHSRTTSSDGEKDSGFDPFRASTNGFINFFGSDGFNLVGEAFYDEGLQSKFRRGSVFLFKDFERSAIRLNAGDLRPRTQGFQSAPALGGLSVERLYTEIQPLRNIRATGRAQFELERASTIEVEINGVVTQTIRLDPGSYDLRNLGLSDGLNEVALIVSDDAGRRELIRQSVFFTGRQLDPGISIFSAAIGFPRRATASGFSYADDDPTFTGFLQYGVSSALTVGAQADANKDVQMVGADAVVATRLGIVTTELAGSYSQAGGAGAAATFGYALPPGEANRELRFNLVYQYFTENFATLNNIAGPQNRAWTLNTQIGRRLIGNLDAQLGAGYIAGRNGQRDEQNYNLRLSLPLKRFNLQAAFNRSDNGVRASNRALFSITAPLGKRQRLRAAYSSQRNDASLGWSRTRTHQYNDWNARVNIARNDDNLGVLGEFEYLHNRFEARIRNDVVTDHDLGVVRRQTSIDAAVGIGYANGRVAVGQPVQQGFAIVSTHESLGSRQAVLGGRRIGDRGVAKTGFLGPALVPLRTPYVRREIGVRVNDLPIGVDLGGGELAFAPGALTGYAVQLGSAASNTVIGSLFQANGDPYALIGGTLRPVAGLDAPEATFFTNRSGRFVAERVAPGDYDILYSGDVIARITVPESEDGIVRVGNINSK